MKHFFLALVALMFLGVNVPAVEAAKFGGGGFKMRSVPRVKIAPKTYRNTTPTVPRTALPRERGTTPQFSRGMEQRLQSHRPEVRSMFQSPWFWIWYMTFTNNGTRPAAAQDMEAACAKQMTAADKPAGLTATAADCPQLVSLVKDAEAEEASQAAEQAAKKTNTERAALMIVFMVVVILGAVGAILVALRRS